MKNQDKVFEEEFLPHADALTNFAYYLTQDENDVEDLVQDTFLKAYKAADTYEIGTNSKAWLFRIMKNTFINEYKRRQRRGKKIDYEEIITFHDEEDSPLTSYTDLRTELFGSMMGDEMMIAINELPIDYRTILILCYVEEFQYEELAAVFDIPIGTVRSRLARARGLLKEKLASYAHDLGYGKNAESETVDN
ncbi:MAG: sigma-70 family RNA polymerase sigma factor [Saprospiraceae bacterium]|nr:sigma-70 family RNA polymerase sigma factor [Saprospiraceae bacterium]